MVATTDMTGPIKPFNQRKRIAALWLIAAAFLAFLAVGAPLYPDGALLGEVMEQVGIALMFAGIFGRLWSILYVGGRKNSELVTKGPYSITRNPLYFSSMLAISGACLLSGSIIVSVVFPMLLYLVFRYTMLKEAAYLRSVFGQSHDRYAARTPMMWPNPKLFDSGDGVVFVPRLLMRTARDAVFLFALIPVMDCIEYLRSAHMIEPLLLLP